MKKNMTFLLMLVLFVRTVIGQAPAITMVTAKVTGSTITFTLAANSDKTPIQVDFGDGNPVKDTIGISIKTISGILIGSQTLKIYGTGIISLGCQSSMLTALDVTQNTDLTTLVCFDNQLTALDISKNNLLTTLQCYNNLLTTLDVSQNNALTYLACNNNQLSILDLNKNTKLTSLDCGSNLLTALDVSKDTALFGLTCNNNQLTVLDLTKNTELKSLNCNNNKLSALDVIRNTKLDWFTCSNNQVTALDVSKNNNLTTLFCKNNKLSSLDVTTNTSLTALDCSYNLLDTLLTRNTELIDFNCSHNQLNTLDVKNNTSMIWFFCSNNKITTLDVSSVNTLKELSCIHNQLTSLDVSKNIALNYLYCDSNQLTTIDVSKDTSLYILSCNMNQFVFSTLPVKKAKWVTYNYAHQKPISIVKEINAGAALDLSSLYAVNGNTTVYTWKTKSGTTLSEGIDYTNIDGKTEFLKTQADSVYCEMTNETFPDFATIDKLKTTNIKINNITKTEENEINDVKIFSHNKTIYISMPNDAQLSIFDINGRLVVYKSINSGTNMIQFQNSGIYFIKFSDNKSETVRKVFIK